MNKAWTVCAGLTLLLSATPFSPLQAADEALQKKAELVDRMLKESDTRQRIDAKGSDATRAMLEEAARTREEARRAMASGDARRGAELLDKALKLVITASRESVDPAGRQWLHRARHDDLLVSVRNFRDAYLRHLKRLKPGETGPLNTGEVDTLLAQGIKLGQEKKYREANVPLERAQAMVVDGLKKLLDSKALVYELKFDTPKDEFQYEIQRGESYEALIRMVLAEPETKLPDGKSFNALMEKSQETARQAMQKAGEGQYEAAIKLQEQANGDLVKVLRMLGVMIPM
ncbi:MAG: hypothetical protein HQM03_17605 [Magnetococcales bacterium]|nr:hypothetical protein [Magnetococcales bacterium]